MPRHPYLQLRDGRYYYRQCIPEELRQLGCYGKKKDIKFALHTGSYAEAMRLMPAAMMAVSEQFETMRRKYLQKALSLPPVVIRPIFKPTRKGATPSQQSPPIIPIYRKLSDFSDQDIQDFIFRRFIALEKEAIAERYCDENDPDAQYERLMSIGQEIVGLSERSDFAVSRWIQQTREVLHMEGILVHETIDAHKLRYIAGLMQDAEIECAKRTECAMRQVSGRTFDSFFTNWGAHSTPPQIILPEPERAIGDLLKKYEHETEEMANAGNLAPSTVKWRQQCVRVVSDFLGRETPLNSIEREDAERLVKFLPTLPSNAPKRYPGQSLVTAAEKEAKKGDGKNCIVAKTVHQYFEGIAHIFKFAQEHEWISSNPFTLPTVRQRLPRIIPTPPKELLRQEEMTQVFSSPTFLEQKNSPETEMRFWVPLLCLFHGMRANEAAGMSLADVMTKDGITFMNLRETEEQRLKTAPSSRPVPLHSKLLEFGFMDFFNRRKNENPDGYLFEATRNANGSMADAVGKWWGRFIKSAFGAAPKGAMKGGRGIHSLRHSWSEEARVAGSGRSS